MRCRPVGSYAAAIQLALSVEAAAGRRASEMILVLGAIFVSLRIGLGWAGQFWFEACLEDLFDGRMCLRDRYSDFRCYH